MWSIALFFFPPIFDKNEEIYVSFNNFNNYIRKINEKPTLNSADKLTELSCPGTTNP